MVNELWSITVWIRFVINLRFCCVTQRPKCVCVCYVYADVCSRISHIIPEQYMPPHYILWPAYAIHAGSMYVGMWEYRYTYTHFVQMSIADKKPSQFKQLMSAHSYHSQYALFLPQAYFIIIIIIIIALIPVVCRTFTIIAIVARAPLSIFLYLSTYVRTPICTVILPFQSAACAQLFCDYTTRNFKCCLYCE